MLEPRPLGEVHRVVLYPSEGERAKEAALTAASWLLARGTAVALAESFLARHRDVMPPGCLGIDPEAVPADFDVMIALGGDGTLLRAARAVAEVEIPVMGVNLGTLGFLSAFGASELIDALQTAVDGRLTWEPRLRGLVAPGRVQRHVRQTRRHAAHAAALDHGRRAEDGGFPLGRAHREHADGLDGVQPRRGRADRRPRDRRLHHHADLSAQPHP